MKIIFFTNRYSWEVEGKIAPCRVHALKSIEKLIEVKYAGVGYTSSNVTQVVKDLGEADFIVIQCKRKQNILNADLDYKEDEKLFGEYKGKKILLLDEAFDREKCLGKIIRTGVDYVICNYYNDRMWYEGRKSLKSVKWQNIPHCASIDLYKDYGEPKIYDLLWLGAVSNHYPFRQRLLNIVNSLKEVVRVRVVEKRERMNGVCLEKYARLINSSKITVTCSSRYKYKLAKYVEIPLCGSLLAADLPLEDKDFISKFALVLDPNWRDEKIKEILIEMIKNDKERNERIKIGMHLNLQYCSQEIYAARFFNTLKGWM